MKTFVVSEIASNWEGSLKTAKKLISESKKSGANAVKFQMWRATDLYKESHPDWKIIKKSELSFDYVKKLKKFSDDIGIEFFCSAFFPEAVDFLKSLGVKKFKIASRTCLFSDPYANETVHQIAKTKKPVIISMGMGGSKKKIENILKNNKTTFCYCISEYPTNFKKINWNEAKKFNGFSDHTLGITASIVFTLIKKQMKSKEIFIEKHVKLKNSKGPDAPSSIDTEELKLLVNQIRTIEKLKI
ncbi:MAG: N-acetylneuraminate synthase family protein [Pelagibacterales bacterium]|nr:N-acetylneuraminate synthase family protein [Pelagibacterales bacterium]